MTNSAIYNMYGYTKDEYFSLNLEKLVPSDSVESLEERYETIKDKKTYFREVKRLRKDGKIIDVEIHASLINYQGEPHVFSIARDITSRGSSDC